MYAHVRTPGSGTVNDHPKSIQRCIIPYQICRVMCGVVGVCWGPSHEKERNTSFIFYFSDSLGPWWRRVMAKLFCLQSFIANQIMYSSVTTVMTLGRYDFPLATAQQRCCKIHSQIADQNQSEISAKLERHSPCMLNMCQ